MAQIQISGGNVNAPEQLAKRQARQALQQYDAALADLTDNWAGFTSAQKVEAIRAGVVILMKAVRFLMLRQGH